MWVCGVTGTNGKTSCSQWLAHALSSRKIKTAVIGTLGAGFPSGAVFHRQHHARCARGASPARAVQVRRRGCRGDGGVLARPRPGARQRRRLRLRAVHQPHARPPRLSRHDGGLRRGKGAAVRCAGAAGRGAQSRRPLRRSASPGSVAARGVRTIGYGLAHALAARDAADDFVVARDLRVEGGITHALLQSSWGEASATINQIGLFNVANALGVLGCLVAHGVPFREARGAARSAAAGSRSHAENRRTARAPAGGGRLRAHPRCARQGDARPATGRALARRTAGRGVRRRRRPRRRQTRP